MLELQKLKDELELTRLAAHYHGTSAVVGHDGLVGDERLDLAEVITDNKILMGRVDLFL